MTLPTDVPAQLDAESLYTRLLAEVSALLQSLPEGRAHLVGIHSGGSWLAERLHADLDLPGQAGMLDVSFYRDDFDRIGLHAQVRPSSIGFDVDNKHLVLVDDVLYTGRTIRAAMNTIFDYGRPDSIKLAVLVDRGGRELPVCADIVAGRADLPSGTSLVLSRGDTGKFRLDIENPTAQEPQNA